MLTREENRLITLTGPGTPGGALIRCYWHPIALTRGLPQDAAPNPVLLASSSQTWYILPEASD